MNAAWQEAPMSIRAATRSANRGRQRSSSRSPSTQPSPKPAVISAQDFAPSISSAASTGPSTKIEGSTTTWYDAMPPRKASTQERLRTSRPALLEAGEEVRRGGLRVLAVQHLRRRPAGAAGRGRPTETANVPASNRNAPPGPPANATSRPPSTGPTIAPTE